jgi:hypothetical protein
MQSITVMLICDVHHGADRVWPQQDWRRAGQHRFATRNASRWCIGLCSRFIHQHMRWQVLRQPDVPKILPGADAYECRDGLSVLGVL